MKKRIIRRSIILMLLAAVLFASVMPVSAASKVKCYTFATSSDNLVKCKITKNTITVLKTGRPYMAAGKQFFDGTMIGGKRIKKAYKFKLANKIYKWELASPSHPVKKFGVQLYVTSGKTIKKSKLYKERKKWNRYVVLYLIVKNGKVVSIGASA